MDRIKSLLDRTLETALIVLMAAMALDVIWQIFTRFVLNDPSSWTEELARFLMIWLCTLGAAYGVSQRFHLEMDYFLAKSSGAGRVFMDRVIESFVLLFSAAVMFFGGWCLVSLSYSLGQTSPALGLPLGTVYLSVPVSGALMVFFAIFNLRHPRTVLEPQTLSID